MCLLREYKLYKEKEKYIPVHIPGITPLLEIFHLYPVLHTIFPLLRALEG